MSYHKIVPFDQAVEHFARLRAKGKRIVQCHGTFDLVHPGHIAHFEESKALGDVMVITLTGEKFVNKGPGRPYFNDQMRSHSLAALECVNYVVVVPYATATEAIECVRPNFYCKGREYENPENDVTGMIGEDVAAVQRVGGEVRYIGSVVFSSTRLLNQHFDPYPSEVKSYCQTIAHHCSAARMRELVDGFSQLRVLIVGDLIFDRYTTLEVQGLTSKNRILSGRFVNDDMQAGGALAVFRHIREFTSHVKLVSLVGTEPWLDGTLSGFIQPTEEDLVRSPEFTTVVKQRFIEPRLDGQQLSKLFSVNFINKRSPSEALQRAVLDRIAGHIDQVDLVVVMDFGHGLLEDLVRTYLQEKAPFLAVNCQTNSNNHGFNIINRRYRRADSFSLDLMEMTLAVGRREYDFRRELSNLAGALGSRYAWLTRGSVETLGCVPPESFSACAPFERVLVDALGAGDAFSALASMAACQGLPLDVATFMGQLAGAQAVRIAGNAEPIRKAKFLKGAASMLAF